VPALAFHIDEGSGGVMAVMIGVDPYKGSHTAVAIEGDESQLAAVMVRATRRQVSELLGWAARFEDRTGAIESAGGLGYLLARQLVAAGERVLDVPATLAARVRVLGSGRSNKNDPNDALSVAVAALRAPRLARVGCDDSSGVLRLYAKRNTDLGGLGIGPRVVCMRCWRSSFRVGSPRTSTPRALHGCSRPWIR
jgi:transposase